MADNYLERKMEEYRSRKPVAARRRLIPSGASAPKVEVPLGDLTVLIVGIDESLVTAFSHAGAHTLFCNEAEEALAPGRRLAERTGSRHLPFLPEKALAAVDYKVDYQIQRTCEGVLLRSVTDGTERLVAMDGSPGTEDNPTNRIETLAVLFCTPKFSGVTASVTAG